MTAMRRLPLLVALAVAFVACDGGRTSTAPTTTSPQPRASSAPTTDSAQPSVPARTTPASSPRPIPPAWATPIDADLPPEELPSDALIPPDAQLTGRVVLPAAGGISDEVAVAYVVGSDPFAAEHGFALWRRFEDAPAWSVVFAFVDAPRKGVLGIRLEAGDLTADGHDELLTFEDTGGTGACGTWRVIAGAPEDATEIFRRKTCDTEIRIVNAHLEIREAVYETGDPHCCPSEFRISTLRWSGAGWREVGSEVQPVSET